MKNYLKPISMTFMATVLCVSSANAGLLDSLDPRNIGKKISDTFRPGRRVQPGQPGGNIPTAPIKDYGPSIPAPAVLNQSVIAALSVDRTQIGQTAIDLKNLRELYALHGNRAFWTNENGLSNMGLALQDILTGMATLHGLESQYYLTADVNERLIGGDWNSVAELDILLTQGYMLFVKDVSTGRINPQDASQGLQDIEMKKATAPSLSQLNAITTSPEALLNGVGDMTPNLVGYSALVESMAKINDGINAGGWIRLDPSVKLKMGDSHANVIGLRQRLVDFGYLPYGERSNPNQRLDAQMNTAIRKFQEYNFLTVDGIVGNDVYRIMTQPVQKFQNQIRANLEKWRFHPRNLPQRYLMVDMGRQQLDVVQNGQLALRMNTVVGADVNGTPTMTDKVTSFLLAPYWHSPKSIMVKETIPNFGADPAAYLAARNVEVLSPSWQVMSPAEINQVNWRQYTMANQPPYTFREKNGEGNSLGLVKFNLTNGHAIYLHDTNNKGAFKRRVRYLSHGCIRLEQPFELAEYLMPSTSFRRLRPAITQNGAAYFVSSLGNRPANASEGQLKGALEYVQVDTSEKWRQLALELVPQMDQEAAIQKELQSKVSAGIASGAEKNALEILKAYKANPTVDIEDLPVFIFSSTTVNYADGAIGFGDDIYKQDERIIKILDQMSNTNTSGNGTAE